MEDFNSMYYVFIQVSNYLSAFISDHGLKLLFLLFLMYLGLLIYAFIQDVAGAPSAMHYMNLERTPVPMSSNYNPFSFEADYSTASFLGIKCVMKSEKLCHVQAFWGVPIASLFELLQSDWNTLIHALTSRVTAERFSVKCVCANDPFELSSGEEKTMKFKPFWNISESLAERMPYLREVYPLVVLMVLRQDDEVSDESTAVAMANVVHIPDRTLLLPPQLLGQYVKLFSGPVGHLKKVFLSTPIDDDGYSLCLACYHRPASMVYLPCRHACLCNVCFDLVDRCPICRNPSLYYFEMTHVPGREARG